MIVKNKIDTNGNLTKVKARSVTDGHRQVLDTLAETMAPIANKISSQATLALSIIEQSKHSNCRNNITFVKETCNQSSLLCDQRKASSKAIFPVDFTSTDNMQADILTKALKGAKFKNNNSVILGLQNFFIFFYFYFFKATKPTINQKET